ncbi:translation machinery-associated protein 46 [[Candida] jaroonii]|uniref:Translation machinery-associated protein 46 n=1 Tax=[Candida] jaroonii TaxID=467808 RepID=A0ACA9Y7S7_9ASCO|nr:translation machinery-associated protein 46 [[Candida] jaroonii]
MAPKKQQPSDKNKAKARAQKVDDKTFGLKNKNKSKKVQQQIAQIKTNADGGLAKKKEAEAKRKAEEKKAAEQAKKEAAALFGISQQKVPFGVDPKSVLCEFFRKGVCTKGNKCKFSHDINVGRKDAKKDLYTDARAEKEADTMDQWDEEKLRSVIMSKHGNPKTTTDIVCKYFIEAVENGKYGWFWVCPNGGNECKYRHSLPPGFVLKTKEQKRLERLAEESAPKITLEDFIELERGKLDKSKFTPITIESFNIWKTKKAQKKEEKEKAEKKKKTGREIVMELLSDKFYTEEENKDEWDLSEFKKDLPDIDDGNIKDYGDGNVRFDLQPDSDDTVVDNQQQTKEQVSA